MVPGSGHLSIGEINPADSDSDFLKRSDAQCDRKRRHIPNGTSGQNGDLPLLLQTPSQEFAMSSMNRRQAIRMVAATGAVTLGATMSQAAAPPAKRSKANAEPKVASKASPDSCGPRELFAVIDETGQLRRGLHAASAQRLEMGVYEILFTRDVRRGVYIATPGGHGYDGVPLPAALSVIGRATDPRGVLIYATDMQGDPTDVGIHLLVLCPDGYA
jgi:hypothetical protein